MLDFLTQMMGSASPVALNQGMGQSSFPASLIQSESGGNWGALNNERGSGGVRGHGGRLQFGDARLTDAARAGVIPRLSPDQFAKQSPRIQRRVEEWHFRDIDDQIRRRGLDRFVGEEIDGQPVTMDAMRSVAHLGGMGGLQKFLETGGRHNPQDSFGTSLSDYHRRHGGGQSDQPRRADMPAQGAMPASMESPMQPRSFDDRFGQLFNDQSMGQGRPIPQAPQPQPRRTAEAERVEPVDVPSSLMDPRPISGRSDMMEPGRRLAPEPQGNEGFRIPGGPGPRPDMVSPPADMPARGARPQSGQVGANVPMPPPRPQNPQLPPPPEDPDRRAMGVEPRQNTGLLGNLFGGGRQQGNQQDGERQGFMSPAMSDFFTAMGESLLTSPGNAPLSGFPKAMQGLRLASQEREKSQAEQNAISAVLRQLRDPDGNQLIPDDLIAEVRVNPQAAQMLATQAQTMEDQRRARELEAAEVGMFAPPGFDGVGMPQVSPTPAPGAGQPLPGGADQPMPAPGADPDPLPQDLPRGMTPEAQAEIDVIDRELAALDQTEFEYQRRSVATPGGKAQQEAVLNQIQRLRAARQERRAQLMPAEMPFSDARQVATEFNRETQDHVEVFRRFNEMNKFLNNPSGTSDSQAFNILQRMFDPGMRRPGSESDEPMGTSYLDRAQNAFELWKDGELATPDLRRELMFAAESYLDGYMRDYANLRAGNEEFVSAYFPGTDPSSIFRARDRQFESVNQALADIPAPGAADDSEQPGIFEQARSFLRRTFGVSDADIDRIPSDSIEAEIRRRQQER